MTFSLATGIALGKGRRLDLNTVSHHEAVRPPPGTRVIAQVTAVPSLNSFFIIFPFGAFDVAHLTADRLDAFKREESLITLNTDPAQPVDGQTLTVVGFGRTLEGRFTGVLFNLVLSSSSDISLGRFHCQQYIQRW